MFVTTPIINFIPWQERQTGNWGSVSPKGSGCLDVWMFIPSKTGANLIGLIGLHLSPNESKIIV